MQETYNFCCYILMRVVFMYSSTSVSLIKPYADGGHALWLNTFLDTQAAKERAT